MQRIRVQTQGCISITLPGAKSSFRFIRNSVFRLRTSRFDYACLAIITGENLPCSPQVHNRSKVTNYFRMLCCHLLEGRRTCTEGAKEQTLVLRMQLLVSFSFLRCTKPRFLTQEKKKNPAYIVLTGFCEIKILTFIHPDLHTLRNKT